MPSTSSNKAIVQNYHHVEEQVQADNDQAVSSSRRSVLKTAVKSALVVSSSSLFLNPQPVSAKSKFSATCTDLESCREIGEQKDAANLAAYPIVRLGDQGLQYKVLAVGLGDETVTENTDSVKIAYSISQASGSYMYSQGFGFNKLDAGNGKQVADLGLDGITVHMKNDRAKEVPVGVKQAIVGMKRGEKRRIVVPPALGFETSDWNPKPSTFRGERQIISYQNVLTGRRGQLPPFPAPTIWDSQNWGEKYPAILLY
eukprot:scaffold3364_cov161-Amphora_coffeaeformis.AAC.3